MRLRSARSALRQCSQGGTPKQTYANHTRATSSASLRPQVSVLPKRADPNTGRRHFQSPRLSSALTCDFHIDAAAREFVRGADEISKSTLSGRVHLQWEIVTDIPDALLAAHHVLVSTDNTFQRRARVL